MQTNRRSEGYLVFRLRAGSPRYWVGPGLWDETRDKEDATFYPTAEAAAEVARNLNYNASYTGNGNPGWVGGKVQERVGGLRRHDRAFGGRVVRNPRPNPSPFKHPVSAHSPHGEGMLWEWEDYVGNTVRGFVESIADRGGSDISYTMHGLDERFYLLSGSRLRTARQMPAAGNMEGGRFTNPSPVAYFQGWHWHRSNKRGGVTYESRHYHGEGGYGQGMALGDPNRQIKRHRHRDQEEGNGNWSLNPRGNNPQKRGGRVYLSAREVDAFRRQYPASHIPPGTSVWFAFDSRGDLVDMGGNRDMGKLDERGAGGALLALSQDAQTFLETGVKPDYAS